MPFFVDARETRCAMADLVESSGGRSIVDRVASRANNAFVRDLDSDEELRAWLADHDLTLAEAARIQPAYDGYLPWDFCGGSAVARFRLPEGGPGVIEKIYGTKTAAQVGYTIAPKSKVPPGTYLAGIDSQGYAATPSALVVNEAVTFATGTPVVTETEAAGLMMEADCVREMHALYEGKPFDAGLESAQPTSTDTSCSIAGHDGGGDLLVVLGAMVVLRSIRGSGSD